MKSFHFLHLLIIQAGNRAGTAKERASYYICNAFPYYFNFSWKPALKIYPSYASLTWRLTNRSL